MDDATVVAGAPRNRRASLVRGDSRELAVACSGRVLIPEEAMSSVDGALEHWSVEQTERGKRLAALGDQMEVAFVWEAPDLSSMTEPDARAWWAKSIAFPEEFSYVSEAEG